MGGLYNFVNNYLSRKGNGKSAIDLALNDEYLVELFIYIFENGEALDNEHFYITDVNKASEILKINILDFINHILHKNTIVHIIGEEEDEFIESYIMFDGTYYTICIDEPFIMFNENLSEIKIISGLPS